MAVYSNHQAAGCHMKRRNDMRSGGCWLIKPVKKNLNEMAQEDGEEEKKGSKRKQDGDKCGCVFLAGTANPLPLSFFDRVERRATSEGQLAIGTNRVLKLGISVLSFLRRHFYVFIKPVPVLLFSRVDMCPVAVELLFYVIMLLAAHGWLELATKLYSQSTEIYISLVLTGKFLC
jgi:hypothetical protein